MKPSTSRCDDIGRVSASCAWIPLQNGEAKLMVHKVTVRIVNVAESSRFGLSKTAHGQVYRLTRETRVQT